jgi:hypothetical protein
LIFNAAYSSEYNPIERLWAITKKDFYKEILSDRSKTTTQEIVEEFIKRSLERDSSDHLQKHVKSCLQSMNAWLNQEGIVYNLNFSKSSNMTENNMSKTVVPHSTELKQSTNPFAQSQLHS